MRRPASPRSAAGGFRSSFPNSVGERPWERRRRGCLRGGRRVRRPRAFLAHPPTLPPREAQLRPHWRSQAQLGNEVRTGCVVQIADPAAHHLCHCGHQPRGQRGGSRRIQTAIPAARTFPRPEPRKSIPSATSSSVPRPTPFTTPPSPSRTRTRLCCCNSPASDWSA